MAAGPHAEGRRCARGGAGVLSSGGRPHSIDPRRHPERALDRQRLVLERLGDHAAACAVMDSILAIRADEDVHAVYRYLIGEEKDKV